MTDILIRKGNWDTDRQRQGHVRTAKEEGHLQAKKRGLKRKQGLQGSNFLFKPLSLWDIVMVA